jgi:hypothetical protein
MAVDKIFYNLASSEKLGWKPEWFGAVVIDDDFIDIAKKWQKKNGLRADGMIGPVSHRIILAEVESKENGRPKQTNNITRPGTRQLIHNGKRFAINWDKVILWDEPGGLKSNRGSYNDMMTRPDRRPSNFVIHWDACLSAESCANVLNKRNISVHFCIDNDGTIYQLCDTQNIAWHAGSRLWNSTSVGVEISNAYYTKYQNWYIRNGFGARPIIKNARCHGRSLPDFLGFYDVQIEALQALIECMNIHLGIPLECPTDQSGKLVEAVDKRCESGKFAGFMNHYNLTRRKIDCAGLDLVDVLSALKKG